MAIPLVLLCALLSGADSGLPPLVISGPNLDNRNWRPNPVRSGNNLRFDGPSDRFWSIRSSEPKPDILIAESVAKSLNEKSEPTTWEPRSLIDGDTRLHGAVEAVFPEHSAAFIHQECGADHNQFSVFKTEDTQFPSGTVLAAPMPESWRGH